MYYSGQLQNRINPGKVNAIEIYEEEQQNTHEKITKLINIFYEHLKLTYVINLCN
jgi:hypothetical protein